MIVQMRDQERGSDMHKRRPPGSTPTSRVRVMIVEDSPVVREFLHYVIGRDERLEVVAAVRSAEEALRVIRKAAPHVISMDIRLPGMNGLEATRQIMTERPTPIVVFAASVDEEDLKISMNALKAGALAVLEKPAVSSHAEYEAIAEQICTRLVIMSRVNVVRQRFRPQASPEPRWHSLPPAPIARPRQTSGSIRMIGVVASTGGPNALDTLLKSLPPGFPVPIAVVQHITASFQEAFVAWLRDTCPLPVVEAATGLRPQPGVVYVAPADRHLHVDQECFRLGQGDAVALQRPSGTVLLESIAASHGAHSIGVLLTGMGEDGAAGLRSIHDAGGYTIAEDQSTAVVFGMPAAAIRMSAVSEVLPLQQIAARLLELVG